MGIKDMHKYFRQYAQQVGMQNTRAILPEQIDIIINTSITDTVNQIIRENVGVTNDRVITDNSKIGQINALRSLYVVDTIDLKATRTEGKDEQEVTTNIFNVDADSIYPGLIKGTLLVEDFLFLIDFAVNYKKVNTGLAIDDIQTVVYNTDDSFTTNYFPVRLIDDIYLADVLNDFILKPSLRSPILTIYNNTYDFYFETLEKKSDKYILPNNLLPYKFRCSYIKKPNVVKYGDDLGVESVDCNLPEYLHVDIVKHAVDLYRAAVSGSLYAAQQQEQAAQRENTRNNYRNEQ